MSRVCVGALALLLAVVCVGCGEQSTQQDDSIDAMVESAVSEAGVDTSDVAAVVSGRIITQDEVKDAIQARRVRLGLTSDEAFDEYLKSGGLTVEDVRASVLKEMVDDVLVEIEADNLGIDVSNEAQSRIDAVRDLYPTEAAYIEAIESKGYTQQTYETAIASNILEQAVRDEVVETPIPTEDQIKEYAAVVAPLLVGKKSSEILVSSTDYATALEVAERIANGEDFAELAREYSIDTNAEEGGDAGWDSLNSFVTPYQNALGKLEVGEVSDIVRTRFGYQIIMCTDEYAAPTNEDGSIDISAIPMDLMEWIVDSMSRSLDAQLFEVYMDNLEVATPIAVFDEQGEQVKPASIGLATETVKEPETVDEIIDEVQQTVQEAAQEGAAAITVITDAASVDDVTDGAVAADADIAGL